MTIDHGEQLRQLILLRFAKAQPAAPKPAAPAAPQQPPSATPALSPQNNAAIPQDSVGNLSHEPVVSASHVTYGSAIWAHGNAGQKSKEENAYQHPNTPTTDKANPLGVGEGFPQTSRNTKAPPEWRDEAKKQVIQDPTLGDHLYSAILHLSSNPNTDFGKANSQVSQNLRNQFVKASKHFPSLRNAMSVYGSAFEKLSYMTKTPVDSLLHQIRHKIANGASGEELENLTKAYKWHVMQMVGMSERAGAMTVKSGGKEVPLFDDDEARLPALANDEGVVKGQSGAAKPKKRELGNSEDEDRNTAEAKKINQQSSAFMNKEIFSLYRQMRDETRAGVVPSKESLKAQISANRDADIAELREQVKAGTHPETERFLYAPKYSGRGKDRKMLPREISERNLESHINKQHKAKLEDEHARLVTDQQARINMLGAVESAMSAANFQLSTPVNFANEDAARFSGWYDSGSGRLTSALVHYLNTHPNYSIVRNKFGRNERYDPKTDQPNSSSPHMRTTFDDENQIAGTSVLMSMLGPTSANEKPSNNAKIMIGLMDEGMNEWHRKNADNPEALKRGPSALDILANAPFDKRAYGQVSAYKGQKNYKFWSGIYHGLNDSQKEKYADLFQKLAAQKGQNADLQRNIGNYYKNDDGSYRLAPVEDIKNPKMDLKGFVESELSSSGLSTKHARDVAELLKQVHKEHPVGFEPMVYQPTPVHLYTDDNRIMESPMGLSTRPGSAIKNLHLVRGFHRGLEALNRLPDDMTPEHRVEAVANAINIPAHREDEFSPPKTLLEHLAGTDAARADMGYAKKDGIEANSLEHARNIARFIDKFKGLNPDLAYHDFLVGMRPHSEVNKISPAVRPNYVEEGEDGMLRHRGLDSTDDPDAAGALAQGPKFGNYVTSVISFVTKAFKRLMNHAKTYVPFMTVDRVMMEDLMNAAGRWLGGVPETEFQRANVHNGAEFAARNLAKYHGVPEGQLDFNAMQAAQWLLVQVSNTNLGGINPTEQLYTGVENADNEARIMGHRILKKYAGQAVSPQEQQKLKEWEHFLQHEQPLSALTSHAGEAYAMLNDHPYVTGKGYGGDLAYHEAAERLKQKLSESGRKTLGDFYAHGKSKGYYSRSKRHETRVGTGQGDTGSVRGAPGKNLARPGSPTGSARQADSARNTQRQQKPAAPANSLAGPAQGSAESRRLAPTGRDVGRQVKPVPASPSAGGLRQFAKRDARSAILKFSSQFMRSMLLGTSATSQKFRGQLDAIAKQLGVEVRSYNGVGDAVSNTSPATAHLSAPIDPDRARYLAAWAGLLGNRQSVLMFHPDPKGTDSFYSIKMPETNMMKVRAALDKRGIKHRTIIPGGTHTHIMVYDPQRMMRSYVSQLGDEHDADILESTGRAEFIGRPANQPGADPVSDAREHYRRIIADYEERNQQNQAGAAADGNNSGAPVPGAGASQSPAGGSIVRGITYKGGKFTPGAEQKAAPAQQPGSPARFNKRLYNKSKSLAEQGSMDAAASLSAVNKRDATGFAELADGIHRTATHHRNTGGEQRQMLGVAHASLTPSAVTATGDNSSYNKPSGDTAPDVKALHLAAHQAMNNAGGLLSSNRVGEVPVALATQINALNHALNNTASQGISAHQRYADYISQQPRFSGVTADGLQKILGAASAGRPKLLQGLSQERRKIVHNVQLHPGVTPLDGVITPHADSLLRGEFKVARHSGQDGNGAGEQVPGETYIPQDPAQYGLIDFLDSSRKGTAPVYGTPDGRLFLDPMHANQHVAMNPHLLGLRNVVHAPWHHLNHRIDTFRQHDDLIRSVARDDMLANGEKESQQLFESLYNGGFDSDPDYASHVASVLRREPSRYQRLLRMLHEHLGMAQGAGAVGVQGRLFLDQPTDGVQLGENDALGMTTGAKQTGELPDMAAKLNALFARIYPAQNATLGVSMRPHDNNRNIGTYVPVDVHDDVVAGSNSTGAPAGIIRLSKVATPAVLAHEVAHHASMHIPGIERSIYEKMFAPGVTPQVSYDNGKRSGMMLSADTNWASGEWSQNYAKRITPVPLFHRSYLSSKDADTNAARGHGPLLHGAFPASEYFPTLVEEFFQRPVRMCRDYPHMARLVLGLMSGALRSHQ